MDLVTSLDDIFDSIKPVSINIPVPSSNTERTSKSVPDSPVAAESQASNSDARRGGLRRTNSYLQKREAELEKAAEKNEISDGDAAGEGIFYLFYEVEF